MKNPTSQWSCRTALQCGLMEMERVGDAADLKPNLVRHEKVKSPTVLPKQNHLNLFKFSCKCLWRSEMKSCFHMHSLVFCLEPFANRSVIDRYKWKHQVLFLLKNPAQENWCCQKVSTQYKTWTLTPTVVSVASSVLHNMAPGDTSFTVPWCISHHVGYSLSS